jgi:hypothetical protein
VSMGIYCKKQQGWARHADLWSRRVPGKPLPALPVGLVELLVGGCRPVHEDSHVMHVSCTIAGILSRIAVRLTDCCAVLDCGAQLFVRWFWQAQRAFVTQRTAPVLVHRAIVNGVEMVIDPNDPSNWHTPKNEREYLRSPQKSQWRTAREKKMDQYKRTRSRASTEPHGGSAASGRAGLLGRAQPGALQATLRLSPIPALATSGTALHVYPNSTRHEMRKA